MTILNRVAYLDFKLLQDSIGPDTIGLLAEGHMLSLTGLSVEVYLVSTE